MKDIVFVTAQPDVPYFHWQIKLYVHNFIEKGIDPNQIHVIFGMCNGQTEPSKEGKEIEIFGVNVHFIKDERTKKLYIPSIKPFLIYKWLEQNPNLSKCFFLHDSDIIFTKKPNLDDLIQDDICYLSNTKSYIGYNYIMDCCDRYEKEHPTSQKGQLLNEMSEVIGIDIETIKINQENSGGGQYIIKNSTPELWKKIYEDSTKLYYKMLDYQKRFPIHTGQIQFWTAEMWALLWNLWLSDYKTKISKELDFCWATDPIVVYNQHPILHMAGVTDNLKSTKFYKGDFINVDPIEKLKENPNYFDYVDKGSTTIKYIEIMKSFIQKTNK
jgi:hypothetical protein